MDLAYVPHHGCKNYTDVEFFKRVRARYYVFSGVEPCKDVFNALLEAKKTWENKEQGMSQMNFGSTEFSSSLLPSVPNIKETVA